MTEDDYRYKGRDGKCKHDARKTIGKPVRKGRIRDDLDKVKD